MKSSQGSVNTWLVVELVLGWLRFTPRRKWQSAYGVWGSQDTCFRACIIHCHGPTGFVMGETKSVMVEEGKGSWQSYDVDFDLFWWNFFGEEKMKTKEDKRMVKLDFFSKTILSTFTFWCMVNIINKSGQNQNYSYSKRKIWGDS